MSEMPVDVVAVTNKDIRLAELEVSQWSIREPFLFAKIGHNNFEEYRCRNLYYSESKTEEVLLSLDR